MPVKFNIDMPKGCYDCQFGEEEYGTAHSARWTCRLTQISFPKFSKANDENYLESRHYTCPLKECK